MQLIANALLLLAVSAAATASTAHRGHKQPQQLTSQGHYRHVGRANITGVNPNLGISDNKPAHAGHTGCGGGGGGANAVEDSSTLPPAPPPLPLPLPLPPADTPSPAAVRPVPSSGLGIPTGGVKPTAFVYVSGAGDVVRDVVVVGMGLGVAVAALL